MPEYFIRKHSGNAAEEFLAVEGSPAFSGSHPKTANAVADGTKIKAGALSYKTYDKMVREGTIDPGVCRVIWKTPPYADYNLTAHPDIDTVFGAGFTEKVKQAFIAITDPELLAAFQRKALIEATDEDFAKIRDIATELGMLR